MNKENKVLDEPKVRVTNKVRVYNPFTRETITAEISNTKEKFRFRLVLRTPSNIIYQTGWSSYYEGILVLASQVNTKIKYGYASAHWTGSLPIEKPFIIQEI